MATCPFLYLTLFVPERWLFLSWSDQISVPHLEHQALVLQGYAGVLTLDFVTIRLTGCPKRGDNSIYVVRKVRKKEDSAREQITIQI